MTRVPWDQYMMIIADAVSLRMSCDRARIGAVLTRDNRILATGYGGAPSGLPSCDEVGHDLVEINGRKSCVRTVHAEHNALLYASRYGVKIEGSTLYTTASTCRDCALACIQSGVKRICYAGTYVGARGGGNEVIAMLEQYGVKVDHVPLDEALKWWTPAKSTGSVIAPDAPTTRREPNDGYEVLLGIVRDVLSFVAQAHPGEFCGDWPTAKALLADERKHRNRRLLTAARQATARTLKLAREHAVACHDMKARMGGTVDGNVWIDWRRAEQEIAAAPCVESDSILTGDDYSNLRAIREYLKHNSPGSEWISTIRKILGDAPTIVTAEDAPKKLWQWWSFAGKDLIDAGTCWATSEIDAESLARTIMGGNRRHEVDRVRVSKIVGRHAPYDQVAQ